MDASVSHGHIDQYKEMPLLLDLSLGHARQALACRMRGWLVLGDVFACVTSS